MAMIIVTLLLSLVIATGQGFRVTDENLKPYIKAYTRMHSHRPESLEEKKEVLMNFLGDFLMIKRAKELGLDGDPIFKKRWSQTKAELERRCQAEGVSNKRCEKMGEALKKVLLIQLLEEREVIPRIRITEDEIDVLVENHKGMKKGKKLDRKGAAEFLFEKKKLEALQTYIRKLMKRYQVKIDENALKSME